MDRQDAPQTIPGSGRRSQPQTLLYGSHALIIHDTAQDSTARLRTDCAGGGRSAGKRRSRPVPPRPARRSAGAAGGGARCGPPGPERACGAPRGSERGGKVSPVLLPAVASAGAGPAPSAGSGRKRVVLADGQERDTDTHTDSNTDRRAVPPLSLPGRISSTEDFLFPQSGAVSSPSPVLTQFPVQLRHGNLQKGLAQVHYNSSPTALRFLCNLVY